MKKRPKRKRNLEAMLRSEWGRLDAMLNSAPKTVRNKIRSRKRRIGEIIIRLEKRV